MGAGINTGLGYLGEMGSTKRHSYDVLGDAVSTAARIESKCKEYGCLLLVGGATVEQCDPEEFFFIKLDSLVAKGKTDAVDIYTVLDDTKQHYIKARRRHDGMMQLYRNRKFDEAIKECKYLSKQFDNRIEGYYDMWIDRCNEMKNKDLPDDWAGEYIATTK